ncbi:response regulator transcription factor [Novispirillum itersonii]|uniref:DNA-binding CsgD family transcriptional regulator n=1 Tax=Novispirillum itersonii TaxID=189 RepID=A0A7W9ZEZ3_NOVIT|nr:helix-turn-helix domain-containing protein [Novispirillum itersonii]MBB6210263.1 DNA-binding CsgD family transcriptional regulator [Novispirillum itersonii]
MPQSPVQNLSPRERQCLTLLAKGKRLKGIAEDLGITVKTVDKQVLSARDKLGAATTEQAIAIAIRNNLLTEGNS